MKIVRFVQPIIHVSRKNEFRKHINCADCIYSRLDSKGKKLVCTLFKYSYLKEDPYVDTIFCRSDFSLCGSYADFFKPKKED